MKFNPDRVNTPFYYKGYECNIRRHDGPVDAIEIRLVYRDQIHEMMVISFAITTRKALFVVLRKAIEALDNEEKRLKPLPRLAFKDSFVAFLADFKASRDQ